MRYAIQNIHFVFSLIQECMPAAIRQKIVYIFHSNYSQCAQKCASMLKKIRMIDFVYKKICVLGMVWTIPLGLNHSHSVVNSFIHFDWNAIFFHHFPLLTSIDA